MRMTKLENLVKRQKKCPFGSAIWLVANGVVWYGLACLQMIWDYTMVWYGMVLCGTVWYKKCQIDCLVGYGRPSEVYSMQWPDHLMALIIFNVTQLELQEIPKQLVGKK